MVNAIGGVHLRKEPSKKANSLGIISDAALVRQIQGSMTYADEIDGTKGQWHFVEAEGQNGWIFSQFLTTFKVSLTCVKTQKKLEGQDGAASTLVCGDGKDRLLSNANWFARRHIEAIARYNPDQANRELVKLRNIVSIQDMKENLAIVRITSTSGDAFSFIQTNTIWHFNENFWQPIFLGKRSSEAKILKINSDDYWDVVESSGCCDWNKVTVFFGSSNGTLQKVFEKGFSTSGAPNFSLKIGSCDKLRIIGQEIIESSVSRHPARNYSFDCVKNAFTNNYHRN